MKRALIISILSSASALASFCEEVDGYWYDDYPYTCVVDTNTKVVTVTFANGSIRSFYYCSFEDIHMKTTDAMSQFGEKYTSISAAMTAGGINEKFATENMTRWEKVVLSMLYYGQAKQTDIEYNKQAQLQNDVQNGIITLEAYEAGISDSNARIAQLETDYETGTSGIYQQMGISKLTLEAQIEAAQQLQEENMIALRNELIKEQQGLQHSVLDKLEKAQQSSFDFSGLMRTLNDLKTTLRKEKPPIISGGDVDNRIFTNNMNRISRWLGSRFNTGMFIRPVNPVTTNRYGKSASIATWLSDLGVVGYCSKEMIDALENNTGDVATISNMYSRANTFAEHDNGSKTNVWANFNPPTNWIDNATIVYDQENNVYKSSIVGRFFVDSNRSLKNRYYRVGGRTYQAPSHTLVANKINCLVITMSGSTPTATYATYGNLSALQSAEEDKAKYVIPLYTVDTDGVITCDWRVGADAAMGEFAQ